MVASRKVGSALNLCGRMAAVQMLMLAQLVICKVNLGACLLAGILRVAVFGCVRSSRQLLPLNRSLRIGMHGGCA